MNKRTVFVSCLLVACCAFIARATERTMMLKIGPVWPRVLLKSDKATAWDASVEAGMSVDRVVDVGGAVDFLWHTVAEERKIEGNVYQRDTQESTYMFPVTAYLRLNPVSHLMIHPVVQAQVGLNTMYFSHQSEAIDSRDTETTVDESGFYMGAIWKFAADARYQVGDNSTLFAGLEYLLSRPKRIDTASDIFVRRNMSGLGLRLGVMLVY